LNVADAGGEIIAANARRRAQPGRPFHGGVGPNADIALVDRVVGQGLEGHLVVSVLQADANIVVAALHAYAGFDREAGEIIIPTVLRLEAEDRAAIELAELIAKERLAQKIVEVIIEIERRMYRIGLDPRMAVGVGLAPAARKAEPRCVAT